MILDCLRHGLTDSNREHRFNGSSRESITADQRTVLEQTFFDASAYDAVFVSDLPRCIETATALGLSGFRMEARLRERQLGVFEGLTSAECETRHAEAFDHFRRFDADYVIPGGESRAQHLARLSDWIEGLDGFARVLAVTHGGVIDFLYRLGSDIPVHGGDGIFGAHNAHLSRFELAWPKVRVLAHDLPLEKVGA